jgi:hypothetical protein
MMLPPESALLMRAAGALVPAGLRDEWRREWRAELWWWLSSTPDPSRASLARHCCGAVVDAFSLRVADGFSLSQFLARPSIRLAIPALLLALLAAFSGGFRHTRRALFDTAPGRLAVLTEAAPFMGRMMPLPPARVSQWLARSRTLQSATPIDRLTALVRLRRGVTAAQAQAELQARNPLLNVTPYFTRIVYPISVLGPPFLALVLLALLDWICSSRSAFSLAHPLAWLVLLLLAAVESPASPVALYVPYLAASFLALQYCRRDRSQRCPVCLDRLGMPVCIGVGPRGPFEPAGTEYLCPHGHGVLFTTREAEPESRWTSLVA